MAHQLIFTSSVRGIKPGASGYCTVIRSPGIRPSIERALEGLSVFEHIARNVNGSVQSLRHIELRGVTYYVLSRVSDAGKDYTGRTNFLAHYLVFESNELPTVSPVDLLLNWGGWCHTWSGEPREEAVDMTSFSAVTRMQPPATLWQQQPCGVSPAALLATGADMKVLIQSLSLAPAELLQLIGEAFAIRAQLGQSTATSWKTSFAVGLASDSHAKDFTWIGAYWAVEAALLRQRELIDVAATQVNTGAIDAKVLAIATTGRYVDPPKPIQLTQDPAMRGTLDQALQEQASVASNHTRGGRNPVIRRQPSKGAIAKPSKKRSKLPMYVGLCVVLLAVALFGYGFVQEQQLKSDYIKDLKQMLELVKNGDLTEKKALLIIKRLAEYDPSGDENLPADYEELNSKWTADMGLDERKYKEAFKLMRDIAWPPSPLPVASFSISSDERMRDSSKGRRQNIDGSIVLSLVSGSGADEPSVNDPVEVFNPSPAAPPKEDPIFAKQKYVFFTKVGDYFPLGNEKDLKQSKIYLCKDFISERSLLRSSFLMKNEVVNKGKIGFNYSNVDDGLSIRGKIQRTHAGHAFLILQEEQSQIVLIFDGENATEPFVDDFPFPSEPMNVSDAYECIKLKFNISGLELGSLLLYDESGIAIPRPDVKVPKGPVVLGGNDQVVEWVADYYKMDHRDINLESIEKSLVDSIRSFIKVRVEKLREKSSELEGSQKDIHTKKMNEFSKLEQKISKVKTVDGYVKVRNGILSDLDLSLGKEELSEDNRSGLKEAKSIINSWGNIDFPSLDSSSIQGLSIQLKLSDSERENWILEAKSKSSASWKKKFWPVFTKTVSAYESANLEFKTASESLAETEAHLKSWSCVEVKDGGTVLAKINLGDTK